MKYLTNDHNPAVNGWYDDAEADVFLEHGDGWSKGRAPAGDPDPSKDAPPHPDGRGLPAVPPDPDGLVDAAGRPVEAPKPRRSRTSKPAPNGDGNPDNGGDAGQEN